MSFAFSVQIIAADIVPPTLEVEKIIVPDTLNEGDVVTIAFGLDGTGDPSVERSDLDVMLLLDKSTSMGEDGKIEAAKNAAKTFVDLLNSSHDRVGLVGFSETHSNRDAYLYESLTTDFNQVKNSVDSFDTGFWFFPIGTNIGDAINKGNQELTPSSNIKVEILLSDGNPTDPFGSRTESDPEDFELVFEHAENASGSDIVIFTISLGDDANQTLMQEIADMTGGSHYYAPGPEDLETIFTTIAEEVSNLVASNVVIEDVLPEGVEVDEGTLPPGCNYDSITRTVICLIGLVNINDSLDYSFNVTVFDSDLLQVNENTSINFDDYQGDPQLILIDPQPTVSVNNSPPVIDPITDQTIDEEVLLEFTVTASDPGDDPITLTAQDLPDGAATFIDNGNGTGTFSWTPASNQGGQNYTVIFNAEDDEGATATQVSVKITVNDNIQQNTPPVANDQYVTTDEDTPISFDLDVYDAENDTLYCFFNLNESILPSHGIIDIDYYGCNATYMPYDDYYGDDYFKYIVSDNYQYSSTGHVYITVNSVCDDNDNDGYSPEGGDCGDIDCNDNDDSVYPGATEFCNGIDDDCDQSIDEDWPELGNSCSTGIGECQRSGNYICTQDGSDVECDAIPGDPSAEICDGLDNDCDDSIDNGGDALCDDGLFCNGEEICSGQLGCEAGSVIVCDDQIDCTIDSCNEDSDSCDFSADDSLCNNGLWCDGIESCDVSIGCISGTPIDCSGNNLLQIATCTNDPDSNPLTWDFFAGFTSVCDEENDVCTMADCGNADINLDGSVNDKDYLILLENWNREDCSDTNNWCNRSDINRDGTVRLDDYSIMQQNWERTDCKIITHTCNVDDCNAECDEQNSCLGEGCFETYTDYCEDLKLFEYDNDKILDSTNIEDFCENTCLDDCTCTDCSEGLDCSAPNLNSYCVKDVCGAECDEQHSCESTECDGLDGCRGNDFYDYDDVPNICLDSCSCESNECGEPIIYENDERCTGCQTDDDCNALDADYCEADLIKHNEGVCIDYECRVETSFVYDCNDDNSANYCDGTGIVYDDYTCEAANCLFYKTIAVEECDNGLYCDGQETCENAQCMEGSAIDCSDNDILQIATCTNDPDSNPLTWDFFAGFTSVCDEENDVCTIGAVELNHTCNVDNCSAECDDQTPCEPTACDYLDGCNGSDYYNYYDAINFCQENCSCENNECGEVNITFNDSRCISTPAGGGGTGYKGSGGDGYFYCTPEWSCTDWGECIGGQQTRTCSNINTECASSDGKPSEVRDCTVNVEAEGNESETVCIPREKRCSNDILQICKEDGSEWLDLFECEYGCNSTTLLCNSGPESGVTGFVVLEGMALWLGLIILIIVIVAGSSYYYVILRKR